MALIMPCLLGFNVSIKSQITHQKVICAFSSCGDNRSFCILGVGWPHGLLGPLGQGKGLTVRLFYPVLPGPARPRDTVGISQLQFRIFPSCLIQFHIQDTSWFYLHYGKQPIILQGICKTTQFRYKRLFWISLFHISILFLFLHSGSLSIHCQITTISSNDLLARESR